MRITVDGQDVEKTPYATQTTILDTNILVYAHNKSSANTTKLPGY